MRSFVITITLILFGYTVIHQHLGEHTMRVIWGDHDQINSDVLKPKVELVLPKIDSVYSWGSQIRYSIKVNDELDGDSKYNEINSNEVFLEVNFMQGNTISDKHSMYEEISRTKNLKGLTLLGRSSCFGCHADKSNMTGPSFSDIADSYANDTTDINKLVNSIINGSSGVWGQTEMPANPDLSQNEASDIAEYIVTQGSQESSWIYPGLEGVLRIIDKPQGIETGTYLLTASYTSSAQLRGIHTVVLNVK